MKKISAILKGKWELLVMRLSKKQHNNNKNKQEKKF